MRRPVKATFVSTHALWDLGRIRLDDPSLQNTVCAVGNALEAGAGKVALEKQHPVSRQIEYELRRCLAVRASCLWSDLPRASSVRV